jgi:hypothetical protein
MGVVVSLFCLVGSDKRLSPNTVKDAFIRKIPFLSCVVGMDEVISIFGRIICEIFAKIIRETLR